MQFGTIQTENTNRKIVVNGNEVVVAAVKARDDFCIGSNKLSRLLKKTSHTKYEPRTLFRNKDGMVFYVLNGHKHYLSMNEQKAMEKAVKKIKKMIKKGRVE